MTQGKVKEIVTERLNSTMEAIGSAGFSANMVGDIKLGDVTVQGVELEQNGEATAPSRHAKATTIHYFDVTEDCCNIGGSAHGGFLAWLVDVCSSMPLLALSGHGRWTTSGVSSNINMYYLAAAPPGTRLKLVSTVNWQGLTMANVECKVFNDATGKLIATGTHVKNDTSPQAPGKRKEGKYML